MPDPDPHDLLRGIARRRGLSVEHPPEVEAEAEALARSPGIDDPDLADLRHLAFATIDEATSKDLDQALFLEASGDRTLVWYALADASHYVRPGTALWDEALRRGSSYYLPGLVLPMLPRRLSEDVCSLNPRVDRRALVFRMELSPDGRCTRTDLLHARVRSRAKLTYEGVQDFLDGRGGVEGGVEVERSLGLLPAVGEARMRLAEEHGVVRFRREEVEFRLASGAPVRFLAWRDLRNDVERYNEQISLLCNTEGARFLQGDAPPGLVQPIYRTHEPPTAERMATLRRTIGDLVRVHRLDPAVWSWREGTSLARYLASLPEGGAGGRIARSIHRQGILSSGRAVFRETPGGHHGVGADVYARFTAPMREIVGVFLHDEALEKLRGAPFPTPPGVPDDEVLRTQVIESANRAKFVQKDLERDTNRIVLDGIFGADLALAPAARPARAGTVMGLDERKVHVTLDEPPIDVKIYLNHLERRLGGPLVLGRERVTVRRRRDGKVAFRMGDAVRLTVLGRDAEADRWELAVERAT